MKCCLIFSISACLSPVLQAAMPAKQAVSTASGFSRDKPSSNFVIKLPEGEESLRITTLNNYLQPTINNIETIIIRSANTKKLFQKINKLCRFVNGADTRKGTSGDGPAEEISDLIDYNGDGYLDLEFLCDMGGHEGFYTVWIYDPETHKFFTNDSMHFTTHDVHPGGRVVVHTSCCVGSSTSDRIYIFRRERFYLVLSIDHDCSSKLGLCKRETTRYANGKVVSKRRFCWDFQEEINNIKKRHLCPQTWPD